ncbi:MAG: SsrA-binding protein [Bacteroidota bacterium]
MKKDVEEKIILKATNPKIHLEYEFDYKIECGIVLNGDEVKAIRSTTPSLKPTFCFIIHREVFVRNFNLSKAKFPERNKKLLLHKKQINKLLGYLSQKCYVIIPMEIYEKNGLFKLTIGCGKHLNKVDKREAIKQKEMKKEMKYF